MLHQAARLQRIQQVVGAVGTIVGIKQMIGHANQLVEGNPFQKERAFVLHTSHRRDAHCYAPAGLPVAMVMGLPA